MPFPTPRPVKQYRKCHTSSRRPRKLCIEIYYWSFSILFTHHPFPTLTLRYAIKFYMLVPSSSNPRGQIKQFRNIVIRQNEPESYGLDTNYRVYSIIFTLYLFPFFPPPHRGMLVEQSNSLGNVMNLPASMKTTDWILTLFLLLFALQSNRAIKQYRQYYDSFQRSRKLWI